jgi:DNA-3-methyladenine glycosylase II
VRTSARKVTPTVKRRKRKPRAAPARPRPRDAEAHERVAPIRDEETLETGLRLLRARDPEIVETMLALAGPPPLRQRDPDLRGLAWIVISQQVSTASANAIFARFCARYPDCDAHALAGAGDDELRACGLSAPKMRTLRAIAGAIVAGALDFSTLAEMEAARAHACLVAIHGVGPWTADIFLLFCLGHPDAWPVGDLALQEAAKRVLKLRARPDAKKLEKIGERWRPVRGVAARLLWAWYGAAKRAEAEQRRAPAPLDAAAPRRHTRA